MWKLDEDVNHVINKFLHYLNFWLLLFPIVQRCSSILDCFYEFATSCQACDLRSSEIAIKSGNKF